MKKFQKAAIAFLVLAIVIIAVAACENMKYTVTFDANGGTGAPAAIKDISSGSKITEPAEVPTRNGKYTFTKWYKEAAGTNEWVFATDKVTRSITLYAGWEAQAPVISDVSIASSNETAGKVTTGDTITLTFSADEEVERLADFKILGKDADIERVGDEDWNYRATHAVDFDSVASLKAGTELFSLSVKSKTTGTHSVTVTETTDESAIALDENMQKPQLTDIKIISDNAMMDKVNIGDTITLRFTADEEVEKLGSFKILSSNVNLEREGDDGWKYKATHEVDFESVARLKDEETPLFQINVKSTGSGLYSNTIEATTDGSTITLVEEMLKPQIVNVSIKSSNATIGKMTIGDTLTLTFSADEEVEKLGSFKILSSNVTLERVGGSDWNYKATHIVDADSIARFQDDETPLFQINVKSVKSNLYSVTVEDTTDGSGINIIAPIISDVSIRSSNEDSGKVAIGDTITLTFTVDEQVQKLGNFKILSSNPDTFVCTEDDGVWTCTATHIADEGSMTALADDNTPLFQINVKSVASGIYSVTVEETGDNTTITAVTAEEPQENPARMNRLPAKRQFAK